MNDYIVNWSNGIGKISAGIYLYDITEKPDIGFEFDSLYYETPTNMCMKIVDGVQIRLSEEEQMLCREYCESFYMSDDFNVIAIDPELRIFKGFMKRSECKKQGLEEADEHLGIPDFPLAKLVDGKWDRVVAVITEKGKLVLLPDGDNPKFNFFFTESEWCAQTKPKYASDVYDFKDMMWKDGRGFDSTKSNAEYIIRDISFRKYHDFNIANYVIDAVLYIYQIMEAQKYTSDRDSSTPFIDSAVDAMENTTTKDELVQRILGKYEPEYLKKLGKIHGKMIMQLDKISQCKTIEEIDIVMKEILADEKSGNYTWLVPAKTDPYLTDK